MTLQGRLTREDLGPGAWVLITANGERYALDGVVPADLRGRDVVIEADALDGADAFMAGPAVRVRAIRPR